LTEITCDIFVCVVGVWQHDFWTCGVCAWCDAPGTHTTGPKNAGFDLSYTQNEIGKVLCISTLELQQAKLNIFLYLIGICRRKYHFSAQCHQDNKK